MTKKLQIVRVDNDLVQKANLQIGNNIIGRGAATGCNDGQVVKHAVTINLSPNDEMTITPYQVAPCYMKPAGSSRWQHLKLGSSVPIKPGDLCSLLPNKCWFKIVSMPETMEDNDQTLKKKDEDLNNEANDKEACLSASMEVIGSVSPSVSSNDLLNDKDSSMKHQSSSVNGNSKHDDTTGPVLQEIYSTSSPEGNDISETRSKIPDSEDVTSPSTAKKGSRKRKIKNVNLTEAAANVDLEKRVKWNPDAHFGDQTEISSIERNPSSPIIACQNQASASNSEIPKRDKCAYGTRCYRKNPNHKNNYSHPGDPDYDEVDDRQECPYGLKCYRKNPQHKAQFKHVATCRRRKATPARPIAIDTGSETEASSAEESVDESDYEPSIYTESSGTIMSDWEDSRSDWEDGTTG